MSLMPSPQSRARFLAAAGAVAAPAILHAPARAAQFTYKAAVQTALDHPVTVRARQLWAQIKDETNGRFEVEFFPNSVLGGDPAMLSQLRLGAIQLMLISPSNLAPVVPATDIINTGFALKDVDEGIRALAGPMGAYLSKECAAKGLQVVDNSWDVGMQHVTSSTHPIRTPDDLRGFKVRVAQSRILLDLFKAFEANPAPISMGDLYTALQTHVVDGGTFSVSTANAGKFYEVQNFMSLTGHSWAGMWLLANAQAWNALPPDVQTVIQRNTHELGTVERRDAKNINVALVDKLQRLGLKFNNVDQTPFRARLHAYYAGLESEFGSTLWGMFQESLGRKLS